MATDIKIRIGAVLDGDVGAIVFAPMVEAAKRARKQVETELNGARGGGRRGGQTPEEAAAKKADAAAEKAAKKKQSDADKAAKAAARSHEKAEQDKTKASEREAQKRAAMEAREARRKENADKHAEAARVREAERADKRIATERAKAIKVYQAEQSKAIGGFASSAVGNVGGLARRGLGIGADIARGLGIQLDVSGAVQKRAKLEASVTDIVNSGYQEGKAGPAGVMQDKRAVMADVQKVGAKYGINQDEVSGGLGAFVSKTGDLQTGRDSLEAFAKTSRATGANFEDVANAAGAISNKLGDIPNKAEAVNKVMMAIAGQGKEGAVEIKDLASQMEKLTSQATKFKSNGAMKALVGDDTGANIAMLGVLAQAARKTEKGTAAQATQSAMAFIRDMTSVTATKRIGNAILFDKDAKGNYDKTKLRDPQEIIKDIVSKTKGDVTKLAYLLPNQNSRAVANSFMDPYMKAYQGTKGTEKEKDAAGRAAIDESMKSLKDATLSTTAQDKAVAAAMNTSAAKAEQFQQNLDKVVGDLAEKVIPSLLKLAGPAERAGAALMKMADFAEKNPLKAVAAVAGLGAAKSLAGAGLTTFGQTMLARMAGGGPAGMGGSVPLTGGRVGMGNLQGATGLGTAANVAGSAVAIGAAAAAVYAVGTMGIDHLASAAGARSKQRVGADSEAQNAESALRAKLRAGANTPEAKAELDAARAKAAEERDKIAERVKNAQNAKEGGGSFGLSAINSLLGTKLGNGQDLGQRETAKDDVTKLEELKAQMARLEAVMSGTLKVDVVGQPISAPTGGRSGIFNFLDSHFG